MATVNPIPVSQAASASPFGDTTLTPKGQAALALLRFERLFRDLDHDGRRWFANELAALAEEAEAGQ
jgi:hypothetical protein